MRSDNAIKQVDLPTLARPTIATIGFISFELNYVYSDNGYNDIISLSFVYKWRHKVTAPEAGLLL
jgi:hypothetical protein